MSRLGICQRWYWLFSVVLFTACASGGSAIASCAFFDVPIGATTNEVIQSVGKPYAIHHKEGGAVEYEYIERMKAANRTLEEKHYFLLIKDGKVVSKRVEQYSPPPYIFDSYEMQTTQSSAESSDG